MRGILCGSTARTNEEYKEVIKSRMKIMVVIIIVGIITAVVGFSAEFYFDVSINEHMLGVYSGIGVGLFVAGTMLLIKNRLLLNNDEKLKESRLNNTDERNREISNKAFRIASYTMLAALYAVALVGGLFYPILAEILLFLACVFVLTYAISFKYYNNKM
jgi:vacuolar-type H+-ATPase subunit I/STV1